MKFSAGQKVIFTSRDAMGRGPSRYGQSAVVLSYKNQYNVRISFDGDNRIITVNCTEIQPAETFDIKTGFNRKVSQ